MPLIGKPLPNAAPGQPLGTPFYIAPEVLKGNYNEKCDMWSIGCILFTMLTGMPLFQGSDDAETLAKVSRGKYSLKMLKEAEVSTECIEFIEKLLMFDPGKRISAEEALRDPFFSLNYIHSPESEAAKVKALQEIRSFNSGKRL